MIMADSSEAIEDEKILPSAPIVQFSNQYFTEEKNLDL